ncbi:hypothetical protein, partial [Sagittula salina]
VTEAAGQIRPGKGELCPSTDLCNKAIKDASAAGISFRNCGKKSIAEGRHVDVLSVLQEFLGVRVVKSVHIAFLAILIAAVFLLRFCKVIGFAQVIDGRFGIFARPLSIGQRLGPFHSA